MSAVRELTPRKTRKETPKFARATWPIRNMEEMFENLLQRSWMEPFALKRAPFAEFEGAFAYEGIPVDIIDRDKELLIRAELPGIKKDELDLTVMDDCLTILVDREAKEEKKLERFYRCEITRESLERTLFFPVEVESEKAVAEMHDGILEIVVPKLKKVKKHTLKIR